jgi:hypothetical protein
MIATLPTIRWTPLGLIVVAALGMWSIRISRVTGGSPGKITACTPPSTPSTPEILMFLNNGNSDPQPPLSNGLHPSPTRQVSSARPATVANASSNDGLSPYTMAATKSS